MQGRSRYALAWTVMAGLACAYAPVDTGNAGNAGNAGTASVAPVARPIVLELYTSQGCSSCPPAEALAAELATRADLLMLAYHVDYWDGLGWRDRFSLPAATLRQRHWAQANGTWEVFTPQLIVAGRRSLVGSDAMAIDAALKVARTQQDSAPPAPFTATISRGQLLVDAPAARQPAALDVYAVTYLSRASTQVQRGENAGRTLIEVNVVRSVSRLGPLVEAGTHLHTAISAFPADATRVAVLLQDAGTGAVRDARTLELR